MGPIARLPIWAKDVSHCFAPYSPMRRMKGHREGISYDALRLRLNDVFT